MLEGISSGDVVDEKSTGCTAIVGPRDTAKGFLAGCVPNLQLDLHVLLDRDHAGPKFYANCQIVHRLKALVRELQEQTRFTDALERKTRVCELQSWWW